MASTQASCSSTRCIRSRRWLTVVERMFRCWRRRRNPCQSQTKQTADTKCVQLVTDVLRVPCSVRLLLSAVSAGCVGQLVGHTDEVLYVCWSSSQRMIASASKDHTVRLWVDDTATGDRPSEPARPASFAVHRVLVGHKQLLVALQLVAR